MLCGYGGGAMTRALKTKNILKSLLKGLTTIVRSEKYVDSLGNASSECTSKYLHGEGVEHNLFRASESTRFEHFVCNRFAKSSRQCTWG